MKRGTRTDGREALGCSSLLIYLLDPGQWLLPLLDGDLQPGGEPVQGGAGDGGGEGHGVRDSDPERGELRE